MMDFFELFGIPSSLTVDKKELTSRYHKLSREFHPDFHTDSDLDTQEEVLKKSTEINTAYKVLGDRDLRIKYILDQHSALDEGKDVIGQDFLLEMMDVNEKIMDLQMGSDDIDKNSLLEEIQIIDSKLSEPIVSLEEIEDWDENKLAVLKEYYLKHKYLLRIRENIDKFAPQ